MTSGATSPSQSAWPDLQSRAGGPKWPRASAIAAGFLVAFGVVALSPSAAYKAQALIAVVNPTSSFATAAIRTASVRVHSKPVLSLAALSLNETGRPDPRQGILDRLAFAFGFAAPTDGIQRLAADLDARVAARIGEGPGSLQVIAADVTADGAAKAADAVARALVKVASDDAAQTARLRDRSAADREEITRGKAIAARRRLAELGSLAADPAQVRGQIATQVAALQARVDGIRNVIASGTPPLADRRDMPPTVEVLQTSYIDLMRQLAKARETLGDRHTTIISLKDEVQHASAALSTEWRRLARLAEADLKAAKARQSALPDLETPAAMARRDALADARRAVETADAAFVAAQTARNAAATDDLTLHLVAPAAVPSAMTGLPLWLRVVAAGFAGLLAAAVVLVTRMRPARPVQTAILAPAAAAQPVSSRSVAASRRDLFMDPPMKHRPTADSHRDRLLGWAEKRLERALEGLIPRVDAIGAAFGGVPTIVVATQDRSLRTTSVAIAFARAAAAEGRRVLLVEPATRDETIAGMADVDAEPLVLDFFGTLRVALATERRDGPLFLAPALVDGDEIAAALVRNGTAESIDDLADAFDLIVIDGGDATELAAAGWGGDAFVCVGAVGSHRDDRRFTEIFDAPAQSLLGMVVGGRLVGDEASTVDEMAGRGAARDAVSAIRPSAPRGAPVRSRIASTAYARSSGPSAQRLRR